MKFNPNWKIKKIIEKPKKAELVPIDAEDLVKNILESLGIKKFYKHQLEAIKKFREGKDILIVAPTASGKTIVYLEPAIELAIKGKTILIIYPTKALARDQIAKFSLFKIYGIRAEIYDGDTPQKKREEIRKNPPNILITNFDMLHHILLNNHWFRRFFERLELVVVDELHYYSGALGSHASFILKRLNRITRNIKYIATSATIGNPKEFSKEFFNKELEIIETDRPKKEFINYLVLPDTSYISAAIELLKENKKKTIIFSNSHNTAELIAMIGKKQGLNIEVYRAGITKKKRERIEKEFKRNNILALSSTSALELGIDIGTVEQIILAGYPGSSTSVKQRIGRTGRLRKGEAAFIARDSPLDIYYFENEKEYINAKPEECHINENNEYIKELHILSAAKDKPLIEKEFKEIELLEEKGLLKKWGKFYAPTREGLNKIRTLSLRGSNEKIDIIENGKKIGERDLAIAIGELFEGAIYLHMGETYISNGIDLKKQKAEVEKYKADYYTKPLRDKQAEILEIYKERELKDISLRYGRIRITDSVYGYIMKEIFSGKKIGINYIEPLTYSYITNAFWMDYYDEIENFAEGLHAFEHTFIAMVPAIAKVDPKSLGGISYPEGRMFVYEGLEGGSGDAKSIINNFERLVAMVHNRLFNCECKNGCPRCILDPQCGNDNRYLDKQSAKEIANNIKKIID